MFLHAVKVSVPRRGTQLFRAVRIPQDAERFLLHVQLCHQRGRYAFVSLTKPLHSRSLIYFARNPEGWKIISREIQRNFQFFLTPFLLTATCFVARIVKMGRTIDWSRSRLKIWPRAVGCRCCWNHLWTITSTLFSPVPSGR